MSLCHIEAMSPRPDYSPLLYLIKSTIARLFGLFWHYAYIREEVNSKRLHGIRVEIVCDGGGSHLCHTLISLVN